MKVYHKTETQFFLLNSALNLIEFPSLIISHPSVRMMQPTSATLRAQSNKQTGPLDSSNDENPEMDFQNRFGHLNDKLRACKCAIACLRTVFPSHSFCGSDFVCEYQSDDLEMQSGRMYLSDRFICFDSNKPSFPQVDCRVFVPHRIISLTSFH